MRTTKKPIPYRSTWPFPHPELIPLSREWKIDFIQQWLKMPNWTVLLIPKMRNHAERSIWNRWAIWWWQWWYLQSLKAECFVLELFDWL